MGNFVIICTGVSSASAVQVNEVWNKDTDTYPSYSQSNSGNVKTVSVPSWNEEDQIRIELQYGTTTVTVKADNTLMAMMLTADFSSSGGGSTGGGTTTHTNQTVDKWCCIKIPYTVTLKGNTQLISLSSITVDPNVQEMSIWCEGSTGTSNDSDAIIRDDSTMTVTKNSSYFLLTVHFDMEVYDYRGSLTYAKVDNIQCVPNISFAATSSRPYQTYNISSIEYGSTSDPDTETITVPLYDTQTLAQNNPIVRSGETISLCYFSGYDLYVKNGDSDSAHYVGEGIYGGNTEVDDSYNQTNQYAIVYDDKLVCGFLSYTKDPNYIRNR